ncbi:OLC1v1025370C1 [Oldenlandia corymbosa var. corymbosa]|uniref:OLC1v1025370C1 n=1 Tax=Oldenlandia corymbosa var. corymbosa TaxID=529605 RepID=A0AAV1C7L6_OLDCO|nr:OLC1v1025370C1 [Oldenlandia corymbosa var. corymbosa]
MKSKYFLYLLFLQAFLNGNPAAEPLAKPGCSDTCGNVRIPYPFGIGSNCAINQSYNVDCINSSKPFLTEPNLEVLKVSLGNRTVTLSVPINYSCNPRPQTGVVGSWASPNLAGTPFFYSKTYNRMMVFGCGNAALMTRSSRQNIITGCTSSCEFTSSVLSRLISDCYGVDCCDATIPFYLTDYQIDFTISRFNTRNCSSAFLVDQNWLPPAGFDGMSSPELSPQKVPVVLAWTLGRRDVQAVYPCPYEMTYLDTESGQRVETYTCPTCMFGPNAELVDPYLQAQCGNKPGNNNSRAILVGVSTGIGSLLVVAAIFTLYKLVKRKRDNMIKDRNFKRNGGLLLQQQLSSSDEGSIDNTRIFKSSELEKATDGFNANMILGQGGQGTVYKGMLSDGRIVAIKKSKKVNESQMEEFINEVAILSQVNHRNVVKLLGCCLETEVPLLVYEFIPNGTLFSLIHDYSQNYDDNGDVNQLYFPFTWNLRLRIATEVAGAIAYLHSAISMPIYHRDIKSSNILLDEKYIAKVSDFGTSRTVAVDRTHLTTQVKGTFGYLDPEYFQSSMFTEKSDVYSFGVVLVELLTRKKPISSASEEDSHLSLATRFLVAIDKDRLYSFLDPQVLDDGSEDEVVAVAKLAQRCLNLNGKLRPTMKEVAIELESIKMSAARWIAEENLRVNEENVKKGESESVVWTDSNASWTTDTVSTRFDSSGA